MKKYVLLAVTLFFTLGSFSASAQEQGTKVRIGMFPILSYAQLFVAKDQGWDKEVGLDLDLVRFSSLAVIDALASDDIDGISMATVPFIAAQSRGVDVTIVAALSQNVGHIISRGEMSNYTKDMPLKEALIKFKEEQGRPAVLVTWPKGSLSAIMLDEWLGNNMPDYEPYLEIKYLGGDQQLQALLGGTTDLGLAVEPLITIAKSKDDTVRYALRAPELSKDHIAGSLGLRSDFVKNHPEETKKMVELVYRATKLMVEEPKVAAESLYKSLYKDMQTSDVIYDSLVSAKEEFISDPHGFVAPSQRLHDKLLKHGTITNPVDVPAMFDMSFHDAVVAGANE